jgi:hypothetical protein
MSDPQDDDLIALLAALREAESGDQAPPYVEAAVMKRWDGRASSTSFTQVMAAIAAMGILVVGLSTLGHTLGSLHWSVDLDAVDSSSTVVLIGEPLLDGETVRLVRTHVPMSVLQELGFRATVANVPLVEVDLIVGDDGVARGVRVEDTMVR